MADSSPFRVAPYLALAVLSVCFVLAFLIRAGDIARAAPSESALGALEPAAGPEDSETEEATEDGADAPPLPDRPAFSPPSNGDLALPGEGAAEEAAAAAEGEAADIAAGTPESAEQYEGRPEIQPPALGDGGSDNRNWRDALESDYALTPEQMELFEDLGKRRSELEARDRELARREALLEAAQQEIDAKYAELSNLKKEIEALLVQQDEQEKERIQSLVRIYETMKPKDAARIFDTLETDVLLQVMTSMAERRTAPILAAMSADRARAVTILMAEQKQLPTLEGQ